MTVTLIPASDLASRSTTRWPNESDAYRAARTTLLAEEIRLRRHIQQVAAQRRALPPGGGIEQDYMFQSKDGPVTLTGLFGDHDTLIVYSMMYGPDRARICPMCAALLDAWDGMTHHVAQRATLVIVARSPIDRILACAAERGWTGPNFLSDPSGDYTADYVGDRDADMPAYTIFRREAGAVHHFYSGEGGMEIADPGQDPHAAPDLNPLWVMLDTTPEGRGTEWYPRLDD